MCHRILSFQALWGNNKVEPESKNAIQEYYNKCCFSIKGAPKKQTTPSNQQETAHLASPKDPNKK